MKSIKLALFFAAIACVFISCKKESGDTDSDCQNDNTTKVTYTNTGTISLRVQVSYQLTPQFVPINPIFTIDLAPGASVVKEFVADKYFTVWTRDCATTCSMVTYYSKTYVQCNATVEKQGI